MTLKQAIEAILAAGFHARLIGDCVMAARSEVGETDEIALWKDVYFINRRDETWLLSHESLRKEFSYSSLAEAVTGLLHIYSSSI